MAKQKETRLDLEGLDPAAIAEAINQKYGAGTAVTGTVVSNSKITMVPTGNYRLDLALGGGIPQNRLTEVRGEWSAGKTTLGYFTILSHQKIYKKGLEVIVDVEKSFDARYAKSIGINLDRLTIIIPDSGEQAVDVFSEYLRTGRPTFILFDSIAAIVPTAELESSMDQQHMALQARLVNRMMRVAVGRMKIGMYDSSIPPVTVLAVNQLREKVGVMFGSPETTPGGKGKEFTYSVIIRLHSSPSKMIKEKQTHMGRSHEIKLGAVVSFIIKKNKVFNSMFIEGEYEYYLRPLKGYPAFSYNNAHALLDYGQFLGVIKKNKATNTWRTIKGIDNVFIKQLIADPDAQDELYHELMDELVSRSYGTQASPDEDEEELFDDDDFPKQGVKKVNILPKRTIKFGKKKK